MNEFSHRTFKLWAYTVSHSFLILRSPMLFEDLDGYSSETDYNIDIEFTAVEYLDVPYKFTSLKICELLGDVIPLRLQFYSLKLGFKTFQLQTDEGCYYIVAGSYRIGKNRWVSESRINNPSLEYDEILGTSG
ncbi:hypothetical protein [Ohtaekwangia koreensis]|uniref:Immunity protein 50 n=1 Tax=Ohtaekwangia koreensis TaxID=688867 RepID=A0A1T5MBG0_9BACT|nr:hypothetical protein [Ohtaekwangia koreensis]SKC85198.1 hypothetical protein SAMN05660236_4862 [Ohtaekwangia koreensis]